MVKELNNMERGNHIDCCGIVHIYKIPRFSNGAKKELKQKTLNTCKGPFRKRKVRCMLVEVTLNGNQMKEWDSHLKDIGYKRVSKFRNVNSGNLVGVYHFYLEPN